MKQKAYENRSFSQPERHAYAATAGTGRAPTTPRATPPAALIAATALLAAACFFAADAARAQEAPAYDEPETRLLSLINEYRADNDLPPVVLSDAASAAAEKHNLDLAEYGYTGHETQQSDYYPEGSRSWDRMDLEGYPEEAEGGENLAYGQDSPEQAMEDWKASEGHNENLLDERWKVVGISRIAPDDAEYDVYWGTPFGSEVDETAHDAPAPAPNGEPPAAPPVEAPDPAGSSPEASAPTGGPDDADPPAPREAERQDGEPNPTSSPAPEPEETQEPEDPAGPAAPEGGPEATQAPPETEETETPNPPDADDAPPEDEECDGLDGFEMSPFGEGYAEALKSAIEEKVSCEMGAEVRETQPEDASVGEEQR